MRVRDLWGKFVEITFENGDIHRGVIQRTNVDDYVMVGKLLVRFDSIRTFREAEEGEPWI